MHCSQWKRVEKQKATFGKPKDYQNIKVGPYNYEEKESEIDEYRTDNFDELEDESDIEISGGE